jgi:hypothetical protein
MGGGGKTSKSTSSSPYASSLAAFGASASTPYKQLAGQTTEALQTGGVNAQIPSINRSVDAARSAYSNSLKQTQNSLAASGLSGTAFGQQILGSLSESGGENIAGIGPNVAGQFIQAAPAVTGEGVSALGTAGGLDTTQTATSSFWDLVNQGLGSVSSGVGQATGDYFLS